MKGAPVKGRIVDLSERSRDSGNAKDGTGTVATSSNIRTISPIKPIHEWDVDAVAMLTIDHGVVPNVACVRWTISVDDLQRGYDVSISREGWQHSLTLQGRRRPNETPEQAMRREGVVRFLNELLAASYGVPA